MQSSMNCTLGLGVYFRIITSGVCQDRFFPPLLVLFHVIVDGYFMTELA